MVFLRGLGLEDGGFAELLGAHTAAGEDDASRTVSLLVGSKPCLLLEIETGVRIVVSGFQVAGHATVLASGIVQSLS